MKFTYKNLELTIAKHSLSEKEKSTFDSLVRLGDSEELALWTIEHQVRVNQSRDAYIGYYS